MDIKEIAKELTREEFIKKIKGLLLVYKGNAYSCPKHIGLKNIRCADFNSCFECWINSTKDVKFKDEVKERETLVTAKQFEFFTNVSIERDRQKKLYDNSDKNMDALLVIMVEEVGEVAKAIQNNDNKNLYEELTHAAAVCLQMAERI